MKLTKEQLTKLIKEEKTKFLKENNSQLHHMLNGVVDKMLKSGVTNNDLANELRSLADELELKKENKHMPMHQHDANSIKAMQDKAVAIIMAMNVKELVDLLQSEPMNSVFQRVMSTGQY